MTRRTPMEMSCWRGSQRGSMTIDFLVILGDMLFKRDGLGSGMRKSRKKLKAEVRAANVLNRRIARFGATHYE